ncbi:unnamed protein product [Blepharisma stoltei]|uniref:Uncharacterized protein n=1 Tax=Blepharisma stoltei TaxID=1481888 RepID=A0AAU9K713_9CILI|nr:unnamed protein product [Blepharisma stoltei]
MDSLLMKELNVTSGLRNKLSDIYSDFTHYGQFLNVDPSFFLCFGISYIHSLIAFKTLYSGEANQATFHDPFWKHLEDYNRRVINLVESSSILSAYDKQCFSNYLKLVSHLKAKTNGEDAMRTFYGYLTNKTKVCRGIEIGFRAIMCLYADTQEECNQLLIGEFIYSTEKKRFLGEISQALNAKIILINNMPRNEEFKWGHKLISTNTGVESPIVTLLMKSTTKFQVLFYKECIASSKGGFIFHIPAKPIDLKKLNLYPYIKEKHKIPHRLPSIANRSADNLEEKTDVVDLIQRLSELCIKYVSQKEKDALNKDFGNFINNHPNLRGSRLDLLLHSESENKKIQTIQEGIKRESEIWKALKVNAEFKNNVGASIQSIDKAISDLSKKFFDKTCQMMQELEKRTLRLQKSLRVTKRIIDEAKENLRQAQMAEDGNLYEDLSGKLWEYNLSITRLQGDFLQKYDNYQEILNSMFKDIELESAAT